MTTPETPKFTGPHHRPRDRRFGEHSPFVAIVAIVFLILVLALFGGVVFMIKSGT